MHDVGWYGIIAAIGTLIGLSSGMFGIGGALIATPLLALYGGLPPFLALGTPLPAALPSALSGSIIYHRNRLINLPLVLKIMPAAVPLNILGTWATTLVDGNIIMYATGGFLLLVGGTFFIRGWLLKPAPETEPRIGWGSSIISGVLAGFLSGFLAIGGGIVLVPMFVRVNRLPLKSALATSLLCVAVLSIPGSIGHFLLGHIDIYAMLILTVFVIPSANIGARLAVKLRNKTLERIYGTCMILFAIYFLATR